MQTWKAYLPDEAGTAALGAALARVLQPGLVLHLHGELGAGKTSLTRALLHAAGYAGTRSGRQVQQSAQSAWGRPWQGSASIVVCGRQGGRTDTAEGQVVDVGSKERVVELFAGQLLHEHHRLQPRYVP